VTELEYVQEHTYGGRQKKKPQCAIRAVYEIDGFDKPWEQHYGLGASDRYEVLNDGDSVQLAGGGGGGLNEKCGAFKFFEAVETAAEASSIDIDELLPEEDGVFSIAPIRDRRVRLTNVKFETVSGDTKDLPVIASFEDDEAPAKGKGKTGSKGKVNVETKTEKAITALLDGGPVRDRDIAVELFKANRKEPDVKAMQQLALKKSWLTDEDRPWTIDKKGFLKPTEDDDDDSEDD